jgi:hypothetical protein
LAGLAAAEADPPGPASVVVQPLRAGKPMAVAESSAIHVERVISNLP